jgi:LacI family transcriptional regulator, galactose operon repressor
VKHPYRISEIAARAGLSQATVDRVLHQRGGVRESTVREVHRAIADLDRERSQARPSGPAVPIDVIVPAGVTTAVRGVLAELVESGELADPRTAVIRPRFHPAADAARVLTRSRAQGVLLSAPDTPEIVEAIAVAGMPVVTLGIDVPASKRVAYAGIDHADAGATAAYLVDRWLADRAGEVLVIRGGTDDGEPERTAGFRAAMTGRRLIEARTEADAEAGARAEAEAGVDAGARVEVVGRAETVDRVLAGHPAIRAVYAPGGGGLTRVVRAFGAKNRNYDVFVAHGLDAESAALLRDHKLSAVLHHDLRTDLRHACLAVLRAQGLLPGPIRAHPSAVQVITPFNAPPADL